MTKSDISAPSSVNGVPRKVTGVRIVGPTFHKKLQVMCHQLHRHQERDRLDEDVPAFIKLGAPEGKLDKVDSDESNPLGGALSGWNTYITHLVMKVGMWLACLYMTAWGLIASSSLIISWIRCS